MRLPKLFIVMLSAVFALSAVANDQDEELNKLLEQLKDRSNLPKLLDQPIQKYDSKGMKLEEVPNKKFKGKVLVGNEFVVKKDKAREKFKNSEVNLKNLKGKEGMNGSNRPENLVDNGRKAVFDMEELDKYRSAQLKEQPWSGHYWPIAQGILSARYQDWASIADTWKDMMDLFFNDYPTATFMDDVKINLLSPAEKYDLLVGDKDFSLAKSMWDSGKPYADEDGKIEAWMGICHGWAPAAYMVDRPTKTVSVVTPKGKKITFNPEEIKGLATLLWANASVDSKFIGGRCNDKDPKKDEKTGKILSSKCFDVNPGAWHVATVNQIAINKTSFIIDATYDYEVWNQPVYSYSFEYFNVETQERSEKWKEAMVEYKSLKDPFEGVRRAGKGTEYVVGVAMKLQYIAENRPSSSMTDSDVYDNIVSVTYLYDLELDKNFKVIGGEWYSNLHPDFLWTPNMNVKKKEEISFGLKGNWETGKSIPDMWQKAAKKLSNYKDYYNRPHPLPVPKVVYSLIKQANEKTE